MNEIRVELGARSYPVLIGEGTLDRLPAILESLGQKGAVAICTDSNVSPLYAERVEDLVKRANLTSTTCIMPAGEQFKRFEQVEAFIGLFLEARLDRASLVIALGGGVVGDTAGYAAACFMRGIPFIQIPTTIVAQVDSSVGGKTGVNHALGKNIIGAFHQPAAVLIDMTLLKSLPERELFAGLAEVIKHGIIADEDLFTYMETHVDVILARDMEALEYPIRRSCEIKAAIVAEDEHEHGVRANLNYGHTFGHGIEAATGYKKFLHGEAISLGMVAAGAMSRALGLVDEGFEARQRACLEAYGLPVIWPEIPIDATLEAMQHDKKARAGTLKFVLADRMGHVVHRTDIAEEDARGALAALQG